MKTPKTLSVYGVIIGLALTLLVPCNALAAPTFVNAAAPDLPDVARGVPMGGALRVFDLQLDQYGTTALDLQRFGVFAAGATIEIVGGPAVSVPNTAYFRGRVENSPNSSVFFAVPEKGKGRMHGVINDASGTWLLEENSGKPGFNTRKADLAKELAGRTFECAADGVNVTGALPATAVAAAGIAADIRYTAHMIIDTDYEFWQQFWGMPDNNGNPARTAAAATTYVGDLIAYASIAYEREIRTNLQISYLRLFATSADPYSANGNACGCTGDGKLDEVQNVWKDDPRPRTNVHFISGKSEGCGCAYIGVLCSQGSGYGASSSIGTGFNIDAPGFIWEGMVIAHELGHNFNSPHTHGYCNEYGIADPIDQCATAEGACSFTTLDLPGLDSLTGGVTADHPGTIMSYCHQQPGGYANIAHNFGLYHPYGKATWREAAKMLAHVEASAGCMALDYTGPDLSVVKDCKPDDPLLIGETATCTITVTNLGATTALGVVAVDSYLSDGTFTLGAATAVKGASPMPASTCVSTPNPQDKSGSMTCDLGDIDAGHVVVISTPVSATTTQNVNDRVVVSSDSADPDATNNVAEDQVNFVAQSADVVVTKTCKPLLDEGPYYIGSPGNLPYCEITVTNYGPDPATNLVLTDSMMATNFFSIEDQAATGVTCADETGGPYLRRTITCNPVASLAKDASISLRVTYTAPHSVDINDTARVTTGSNDPAPDNNLATGQVKIVEQADLSITKVCTPNGAQLAGGTATCEMVVTNNGQSPAQAVELRDTLTSAGPFPFTVSAITTTVGTCLGDGAVSSTPHAITCSLGNLNPGAKATVKVDVTSANQIDIDDVATVASKATPETPDPDMANNTAAGTVQFRAVADLSLLKAGPPDDVTAGTLANYMLRVDNHGPSPAVNVVIRDILPAGVDFVSVVGSAGAKCNAGTPGDAAKPTTCQFDTIPDGEFRTMNIVVFVRPETRGTLHNDASVAAATLDTNNRNDLASVSTGVVGKADLSVVKTKTSADVVAGAQIDYQVVVTNDGPSTATAVVLTDTLPAWVTFVSSSPACVQNPTGTLTFALGTLAPGQVKTIYLTGKVNPATPNGESIVNTAIALAAETDINVTNNTATVISSVATRADLWIDKVGNFPTGNPSGTIVYSLYVYNKPGCEMNSGAGNVDPADCWQSSGGPSDAQSVVLTDTLPLDPKTFVVQYVSPNCTYSPTTHKVTCSVADTGGAFIPLPAGAVAGPFQIQAVVKGSKGTFPNTAVVTSSTFDPNSTNNTDVVKTTVQGGTGKKGGGR